MAYPTDINPFGKNRTPSLIGLSYIDNTSIVPVAVDPTDGAILIKDVAGGGSTISTVTTAQVTVNTSAVQFTATSTATTNGVLFGALSTNSASVFIGNSSVATSNGMELQPGQVLSHSIDNVDKLYVISASSTTDKIWWSVV